mgnify:CR=1 FL=1
MESSKKLEALNELSYKTLGRFLGTVTMLKNYSEIYDKVSDIPPERSGMILSQFIAITEEYNNCSEKIQENNEIAEEATQLD